MRAARACVAAAAAREALALHWRSDTEHAVVSDQVGSDTPEAVQAELDDRRRKLERLEQDTGSAAIDAHKADTSKLRQAEQSLWLSGKSRQAMTNYNDVQYVSFLEVGEQTISGILDTGSFELVVFSTACRSCGQAARYNPDLSANHTQGKLATVQQYGSGDTFSQEAWDMVSIGPYPPRLQSFWEVTSAKMPVLQYSAFQSIIGLGPPETPVLDSQELLEAAMSNASNYTAAGLPVPGDLLEALEQKRRVALAMQTKPTMVDNFGASMFSICLGKRPGSDGYLIWSDTAAQVRPGYFQRVQVVGNHTWSVRLSTPRLAHDPTAVLKPFEGVPLGCGHGCGALLDSGTSLLAMPGSTINELVKVTLQPGFNCSQLHDLPSIKLKLGDHDIILPPDAYIADVADSQVPAYLQSFVRVRKLRGSHLQTPGNHCDLMVMESGASTAHGPLWILGVPFFRQYYTTFEVGGHTNERRAVYFSRASDTCTPSAPEDFERHVPPTQLYRRLIHPSKLWVPPTALEALSAEYVNL